MRVLVLAGGRGRSSNSCNLSPFWLECLQYVHGEFSFECLPLKLGMKSSLWRVLFAVFWQNAIALLRMRRYDVIISTSATNGILIAIVQRVFRRTRRTKHVVVDVAMPRIRFVVGALAMSAVFYVFQSAAKILCFASRHSEFWKHGLKGQNRSLFIALGVRSHSCQTRDSETGDYILVAGRAGRDYAVLWDVVHQVDWPFVVIGGKGDLLRPRGDESVEDRGRRWPAHVKLYNEIPHPDYVAFLERCRLVVLPLRDQPFACGQTVLLEAMAAGKAVVASRVAGTEDYVDSGKTGLLVPPGSATELVRSVRRLLDNPAEISRLGANAREAYDATYSLERLGERLGKVLSELAGSR